MRCDKHVEERELHLHFYLRIQGVLLALQCGISVFFEALIPSSCSPVSPAWLTSPQNLHSMVERVADDHASSLVDNNSAHRMIKATVAAALRSHNTHV